MDNDKKYGSFEEDGEFDPLEERIKRDQEAMDKAAKNADNVMEERLREISKKLPDWSLEPPIYYKK